METKIGEIGIGNIPVIMREDLFKSSFPLLKELSEGIKGTDYMKVTNLPNRIASGIHFSKARVSVFFSEEAKTLHSSEQIDVAFNYFGYIQKLNGVDHDVRIGILAWLTDNIMDLDKMNSELNLDSLTEEEEIEDGGE